ncbi:MAG TPA: DUF2085 domain-containing protein [Chloroflexia bacterium]|nr:DUF2085 domain-containing protein [Chloroflexia bacterium]
MATTILHYRGRRPAQVQYTGLTWLILAVLLVGPLVGPLFAAIGWPVLAWINWPLYLMGENVCPQPALVMHVFGQPMLVCSRCWGGVFGLWAVLLMYKAGAAGRFWTAWMRLPERARVALALLAFWPWVFDIIAYDRGWWTSPHTFLILSGVLGGLGAGALLLPLAVRR